MVQWLREKLVGSEGVAKPRLSNKSRRDGSALLTRSVSFPIGSRVLSQVLILHPLDFIVQSGWPLASARLVREIRQS